MVLSRRQTIGLLCHAGSAALLTGCGLASGGASQGASVGLLRIEHTATLLLDGSILVAGGLASGPVRAVQRVAPATGQWSDAGQLKRRSPLRRNPIRRPRTRMVTATTTRMPPNASQNGQLERTSALSYLVPVRTNLSILGLLLNPPPPKPPGGGGGGGDPSGCPGCLLPQMRR